MALQPCRLPIELLSRHESTLAGVVWFIRHGRPRHSERCRDRACRQVGLDVVVGLLAFGERDLLWSEGLIGHLAEDVRDEVQLPAALVVDGHDVPRRSLGGGGGEHVIAGSRVVVAPAVRPEAHVGELPRRGWLARWELNASAVDAPEHRQRRTAATACLESARPRLDRGGRVAMYQLCPSGSRRPYSRLPRPRRIVQAGLRELARPSRSRLAEPAFGVLGVHEMCTELGRTGRTPADGVDHMDRRRGPAGRHGLGRTRCTPAVSLEPPSPQGGVGSNPTPGTTHLLTCLRGHCATRLGVWRKTCATRRLASCRAGRGRRRSRGRDRMESQCDVTRDQTQ